MKHNQETINKIKQNKKRIKNLKPYSEKPKTCAILLSFNHCYNKEKIGWSVSQPLIDGMKITYEWIKQQVLVKQ